MERARKLEAQVENNLAAAFGLVELAELSAAVSRLAEQLRKTQRRCNALSRIFIPNFQSTIKYIAGALEERERESFVQRFQADHSTK